MARLTLGFGIVLSILGLVFYTISDFLSFTALIPSFFGIVFMLLGLLAGQEARRKMAMHIASALALIAFLATVKSLAGVATWLGGTVPERPLAVSEQAIMAVLSLIFFAACIRSFVQARRAPSA